MAQVWEHKALGYFTEVERGLAPICERLHAGLSECQHSGVRPPWEAASVASWAWGRLPACLPQAQGTPLAWTWAPGPVPHFLICKCHTAMLLGAMGVCSGSWEKHFQKLVRKWKPPAPKIPLRLKSFSSFCKFIYRWAGK